MSRLPNNIYLCIAGFIIKIIFYPAEKAFFQAKLSELIKDIYRGFIINRHGVI